MKLQKAIYHKFLKYESLRLRLSSLMNSDRQPSWITGWPILILKKVNPEILSVYKNNERG